MLWIHLQSTQTPLLPNLSFANHYVCIEACILNANLIHIPNDRRVSLYFKTKIPRMLPGSKFTPPVMENPGLTSPAEVVVSDCTISCSLPGVAGAQILFWESLPSLETQTVHLAIRAVSIASWQDSKQLLALGREPLAETGLQGLEK